MEQINVYTSRKKSLGLAALGVLTVAASVSFFFVEYRHTTLVFRTVLGAVGTLFFGTCLVNIISRLVVRRLFLIIDAGGICVDTLYAPDGRVEWKDIEGFTEETVGGQKFIVVCVSNPRYYIEGQKNAWRRRLMTLNFNSNGSPFHIATNAVRMGHDELLRLLRDSLRKYKPAERNGTGHLRGAADGRNAARRTGK